MDRTRTPLPQAPQACHPGAAVFAVVEAGKAIVVVESGKLTVAGPGKETAVAAAGGVGRGTDVVVAVAAGDRADAGSLESRVWVRGETR